MLKVSYYVYVLMSLFPSSFRWISGVDEISMLYGPIIDGRAGMTAAFDGLPYNAAPQMVKLKSVEQFDDGCVWMRYTTA